MRWGFALAAWLIAAAPGTARSAAIAWSGAISNVWSNGLNWVGGNAPGTLDVATFNSSTTACSITGPVSVSGISISVNVTITVSSGATVTTSSDFTQSNGTFTGNNGALTIGGNFNLSSGTFTATSGLMKVVGAFNMTGGTFNANGGRVMLASSASQTFTTTSTTFNNLTINDGLLGYWKLDDSSSPAVDASGYGNNLTWSGTPTSTSNASASMKFTDTKTMTFNGTHPDALSVPVPASVEQPLPITLAGWYKATTTDTSGGEIVSAADSYVLRLTTSGLECAKAKGASSWVNLDWIQSTPVTYKDGTWHHAACVINTTGMTIYFDGTSVATNADTSAIVYQTGAGTILAIGSHSNGNTTYDFTGSIDEVRIYNRALSATQISSLATGYQLASGTATQTMSASPSGWPVVNGDLVIASGVLATGATNFAVGGNWWNYGSFSGTGTLTFNGSGTNWILTAGQMPAGLAIAGTGSWAVADAGSIPLTLTGSYTQSAGTFTSTSGLLNVGGAFNKTGGTFNANAGDVMLSSTTSQTFATNGATFNNLAINDGLIGYWKLDESSSPAIDYSGYGNDLPWQSSATSSATVPTLAFADAKSLQLSGATTDAALTTLPASVQVSLPITLSGWYSATTTDSSGGDIISAGDSYVLRLTPTGANCAKYTGSTWVNLNASVATALNGSWHHLACVIATTGMTIYFDGASVASNADTTAISYALGGSSRTLSIGRHGNGQTVYDFTGNIDEVRIYNRALTQAQITALAAGYQPGSGSAIQTMTGSPTFAGDLVIASGTLSAGSNNLTVGSDWWNYGGMFLGTGTVTFNGSGSYAIRSAGQDFGALTVNSPGNTGTLNDRLSVSGGALILTAGTLNTSGYTVRAGSIAKTSGTLTSTGSTLIVDGATSTTLPATTAGALRVEDSSETSLAGYWKLDNAQGTTFRDYSGNGNTGRLFGGASWVTSSLPFSGSYDDPAALSLDGASGSYASTGATNLPALSGTMTISFWAYYASVSAVSTTSQNMVVLSNGGTFIEVGLWHDQTLGVWNQSGTNEFNATSTPASGWHHLAYTYDGTTRKLYVDGGTPATSLTAPSSGTPTILYFGSYNGAAEMFNGKLDDVRIYSAALTATQIASLAAGRYPGTGGTATLTLGGAVTVDGALALDSGSLSTSTFNLIASNSGSTLATVSAGTLTVGSGTVSLKGGATFQSTGTLTLPTSGGALAMGSGTTLTIDGTLNASSTGATIKSVSGTYTFTVGSTAAATPTLNINGLAVQNTSGGMAIGATTAALPVLTKFDNIAFSSGTGSQLLSIKAASLFLSSSGCSFDAGVTATTTKSVLLAGNGTADGETRVVFGGATCASNATSCQASKSDDDTGNDGIGDTPATNGAVVQFIRSVEDDTAGSIVGFPTAAFDWNTFTYYSTYVAFHNASGGNTDVVYVRNEAGDPLYAWTVPTSGETITGVPEWTTIGSTHYLFVATTAGKVYRLVDTATGNTSGTLTLDTGTAWSTNPFNCSCTISTPLTLDTNNVYWGSTTSGKNFWTLGISNESNPPPVAITPTVTNTALTITSVVSTSYAFMGVTGNMLKLSTAGNSLTDTNNSPGAASIKGRIVVGYNTSGVQRVYAGDDAGTMWALDPGAGFGTANGLWHYASGSAINGSPYYDHATDTIQYGTQGGTIIVLNGNGNASGSYTLNAAYPYTPAGGGSGDPITAAPLYNSGILVVGSTKGKLYFLDRNTGTSVSIVKEYYFGPSQSVSGIGYDPTSNRYIVSTANAGTLDGRVYFFDSVTDPTSSSL
jgi:hypothetical protein